MEMKASQKFWAWFFVLLAVANIVALVDACRTVDWAKDPECLPVFLWAKITVVVHFAWEGQCHLDSYKGVCKFSIIGAFKAFNKHIDEFYG